MRAVAAHGDDQGGAYMACMKLLRLAVTGAAVVALATGAIAKPVVQIKDDNFSAQATFTGPNQMVNPFGGTSRIWFIRSWVDKSTGAVSHQLYVWTTYFWHWRFWQTAADDHAGPHAVTQISRNVESCSGGMCSYNEIVGVDLDDAFLRSRAADGFQIKLSAQSGDELILIVSPNQIGPLLAAIDAYEINHHLTAQQGPSQATPGGHALGIILAGTVVVSITPGSVAEKGGLAPGDLIESFDGHTIDTQTTLESAIQGATSGQPVNATVRRAGQDVKLTFQF